MYGFSGPVVTLPVPQSSQTLSASDPRSHLDAEPSLLSVPLSFQTAGSRTLWHRAVWPTKLCGLAEYSWTCCCPAAQPLCPGRCLHAAQVEASQPLPRVVKHKPSSIVFSDESKSAQSDDLIRPECRHFFKNEGADGEASSGQRDSNTSGEDKEDGDCVFSPELHRQFFISHNRRDKNKARFKITAAKVGSSHASEKTVHEAPSGAGAEEEEGVTTSNEKVPSTGPAPLLIRKSDQRSLHSQEASLPSPSVWDEPCCSSAGLWDEPCPESDRTFPTFSPKHHAARNPLPAGVGTVDQNRSVSRGPVYTGCHLSSFEDDKARRRQCHSKAGLKMSSAAAEIEAKEACDWLRAAGFPQYAQLYEDSQFPIDISAVKKDHDFLDRDLVEPLCRRLNTLNKCASMKLDVGFPKKRSEDSDEDDLLAISNRWTFEWSSRRWSRLQDIDLILGGADGRSPSEGPGMRTTVSSESVLTDLSEPEICSLHSEDSLSIMPDSASLVHLSMPRDLPHYGSLPAKSGRRGRTRAKDFLRRMETLGRSWGPSLGRPMRRSMAISGPVLQSQPEALKTLRCVPIVNGEPGSSEKSPTTADCSAMLASSEETSQSENSVSTGPELKDPVPKLHGASKRAGVYLEDLDVLSGVPQRRRPVEQSRRNEFRSYEDLVVHIPKDHKPGTFPKALSIESLAPASGDTGNWRVQEPEKLRQPRVGKGTGQREQRPVTRCCPRGSRISVYDNVPGSHLYASTGDLMDLEKEDLFPHLDDILQHVNGLQQIVDHWSKNVLPEGECEGDGRMTDAQSSSQITLDFEGTSVTTPSDGDRDGVSLNDTDTSSTRERRDSGVGASLTRPRLRWPSFRMSNRLSQSEVSLQISNQSAGQLSLLQKFSLLRLTAIMEKYSMSNKHGWTWSVPKFMKRMKGPEYRDKSVFGVPLIMHVQRYGQPLPLCLQLALRYLRSQCLDQVGLFRKSGVKSRIQALRQMCENSPESVDYEDQCAYDVADMVKQFFRDLPEPLLTSKMGETFLHIYQYVPKEQRLQAVQAAIMLMADENREVLQTLLCFLSDVTSSVEENQMTPMNLAVCLAPSLFHLNIMKNDNLSPRSIQKKYATGRPDQKDLNENLAATQGLTHMITECNRLFEVPQEMVTQSRNSYMEADLLAPPLDELCKQHQQLEEDEEESEEEGSYRCYLEGLIQSLLKEARDKTKCWVSRPNIDNTELSFKKLGDGTPLRRWRVSVEVEAPPCVVLNRVLRERHLWDSDLLQGKVLETLDKQTEVYQYALNSMAPHPSRDFVVLRTWRTDMPKGVCVLVSVSIDHEDSAPMGGVRGVVLESQYLLEPCGSGKSRLTHVCRMDLKGRSPEWYNKAFGHLCAAEAARIRNSFQPLDTEGPETKI